MTYQLWLGGDTFDGVVDRLTARACSIAGELERDACRAVIDLAFRSRLRQTTGCGTAAACRPDGPVWDTGTRPSGETCAWVDRDPQSLPAMLAAAVADLVPRTDARDRRALEPELAMSFRAVFAPLLFRNRRCGHADVCDSDPLYPLRHGRC